MRPTLVSTTATSCSKAKASTARAVYGPTPGSARSAVEVVGEHPAVTFDDRRGAAVQAHRPTVVAQPGPLLDHRADTGGRGGLHGGEPLQEPVPARDDPVDLRLLEHDLADQHGPRIPGVPPGQVPRHRRPPGQHVRGPPLGARTGLDPPGQVRWHQSTRVV